MVYENNEGIIFKCPKCGNDTTTESRPVVQELYFSSDNKYIGCNCCGAYSENADDYAARTYEMVFDDAKEERAYG